MATRGDVAKLSGQLEDMLLMAQKKSRAPKGMMKCPGGCGADIVPTKNGRVRVHDVPLSRDRCPASGKSVKALKAAARDARRA